MCFLFRLDLILHAGVGKKNWILNFATKQGARVEAAGTEALRPGSADGGGSPLHK